MELKIFSLRKMPEILPGDDLVSLILDAAEGTLQTGDILAITSKIVSKAEGRTVLATDREQAISEETVRVVASRQHEGGYTRIVENKLGIIAAAAGVDNSNVPAGTVLLLPVDPDLSAQKIRQGIQERVGKSVGVIITDTLGRPWRVGQTDAAIGIAGIPSMLDLRGQIDDHGQEMNVTVTAVADELAAAADLVKGKNTGCPVAVIRGMEGLVSESVPLELQGAQTLLRSREDDLFSLGTQESWRHGYLTALREHGLSEPETPKEAREDDHYRGWW